jgi:ubiquinone/menaquinone biosynthesis C-methylase UbiE
VRTQDIVCRYLSEKPSRILDAGGANGFYSFWLSDMGHEVHLLDPVPLHIEQAKKYSQETGKCLASIQVGEARQLEFENGYFDAVLLFGPMYHITDKKERSEALKEAMRVLCKDGLLFCVGISRYASMLDGFFHNLVEDSRFMEIVNRDLEEGQHRNMTENLDYWTRAYFHEPEELQGEIVEAGFKSSKLIAIDGFGWLLPDFDSKWKSRDYQNLLLQIIRTIEEENSIVGISAHMMVVSSKE